MNKLESIKKLNYLKKMKGNYKNINNMAKNVLLKTNVKYFYLYNYMNQLPYDLDDVRFGINFAINNINFDINRDYIFKRLHQIKNNVNYKNIQKSIGDCINLGFKYFSDFIDGYIDTVWLQIYPDIKDKINYKTNDYYFSNQNGKILPATVKDAINFINVIINDLNGNDEYNSISELAEFQKVNNINY